MKASKEASSRLCPPGDVSLSAARRGVSGVVSRASDFARAPAGPRAGAFPSALALTCCAAVTKRVASARPAGCAQWAVGGGGGGGGMLGVRHSFVRSRTRLASFRCLVASACRHVRRAGTRLFRLVRPPARYLCVGWSPGG